MAIPIEIRQTIEKTVIENFGSFEELERIVTPTDLNYIFNYPTDIFILRVWDIFLDLTELGKEPTQSYFILDKDLKLIHEVPYGGNLGLNRKNLEYIFSLKNGEYFHIAYWDNFKYKTHLIWLVRDYPINFKKERVRLWQEYKNSKTPTFFKKGEILIRNNLNSIIKIYYMPGDLNLNPMPLDIIRSSDNQPIIDIDSEYIVFRPRLNGWYTIIAINENLVVPLKLINLRGTGLNKITQVNGSIHLSITSKLDAQSDSYDTANLKRLVATAELDGFVNYVNYSSSLTNSNKKILTSFKLIN